ncbi:hypothetical protein Z957_05145 [Clostridium sp. K25]|nr:hypothetical protein Z957_05145 [Clostridium sp. K25]
MNKYEKLIYENERGQSIEFSVWSPFFLQKIDGLNGLKNVIYTSKSMGQDGTSFIAQTLDNRYISIQGTILKDKSENVRKIISTFNPKIKGKLIFENEEASKFIDCKIEQLPLLPQEHRPSFLVRLLCPNPFWQEQELKKEIALWKGDFHFPLVIPNQKGIIMGHREPSLIVNIFNKSDIESPMRIEFRARATLENPSLFNVNTREFIKINKQLKAGETITINTAYGNKKIIASLNGIHTNAFNYIDEDSTFLQLYPGDNVFRYNADKNIDNLEVSIYYTPQYLGV